MRTTISETKKCESFSYKLCKNGYYEIFMRKRIVIYGKCYPHLQDFTVNLDSSKSCSMPSGSYINIATGS